ncbi:ATP-binding protein [Myxococcota bacterium]
MSHQSESGAVAPDPNASRTAHYRELLRHTIARLVLLYFLPLLLLAIFFNLEYRRLDSRSRRAHLEVTAEYQASTLDLFLRERLINLANLINDPLFQAGASPSHLRAALDSLQQTSEAFVDLGVIDGQGNLVSYHGPVSFPGAVSYRNEAWFRQLVASDTAWIITDIYLGFREKNHFTIAVKRHQNGTLQILRSTLSSDKLDEYLDTLEGASEVRAAVINGQGVFQIVTARVGTALSPSPYLPPSRPRRGHIDRDERGGSDYAYAWLKETPWALVVEEAGAPGPRGLFAGMPSNVFLFTLLFFVVIGLITFLRARQLVGRQLAMERHEAELSGQLVQAAKLASVGELAAGIAHEINNPLAIIAEEIGLLKDSLDPELADEEDEEMTLEEHLDIVHEAVFRCRDITRKLLSFVRQTEVKLASHHVHNILDDVVEGMLANELSLANVQTIKQYDERVPDLVTDRNQLVQVLVNLVKNAVDAMADGGRLTMRTVHLDNRVLISVQDTGCGMTPEQLEKVFVPFFTTKEPGKGTGLGLSVSYGIVKSFGGEMYVESVKGKGSTFTLSLPYALEQ